MRRVAILAKYVSLCYIVACQVAVKRVIPPRKSTSNSADRFRLEEAPVSPVLASSCVVCPGISLEGMDSTDGTTSMHRSSVIVQPQALKKRRWWTSMETGEQALWKKHREDFVQEIRLLSKIRHPSITTVMGELSFLVDYQCCP